MTQRDKATQRIMSVPIKTDITFDEVKNFLLSKGFVMLDGKGDHIKFTHDELEQHLSIPCKEKTIKIIYIRQIQRAIKFIGIGD